MSVTEYTPVSFSPGDPLVVEKLNAAMSNIQLLNERTPVILYSAYGITKDKGLRVYSTTATIAPRAGTDFGVDVYFGNFFSTSCKPVVTVSLSTYPQKRFHLNIKGLGGTLVIPDHRGCSVGVNSDELNPANNKLGNTVYVNVNAVGW